MITVQRLWLYSWFYCRSNLRIQYLTFWGNIEWNCWFLESNQHCFISISLGIVWGLSGDCLEIVWKLSGECLEIVWGLSGDCLGIVWRLSGDFTPALKTWSLPTNCDHKASALQFRFWWQEKTTHQHDCSWYAPSCVSLEQQCESSKDSRTVSLLCEFSHVVTFYVCPSLPLWFHIRDICVSHCVGQDRCESRSIPRIPASSDNEGSLLPPCYPLLDHSYLYGKQKV